MKLLTNLMPLAYFITFGISCSGQNNNRKKSTYNLHAVELNKLAMKIYSENTCNKDSILKSLNLLQQAINLDSSYYSIYGNKAVVYCALKKYVQAINTLKKITDTNSEYVELKTFEGFIYEKMLNPDSSLVIYKESLKQYDKKIKQEYSNVSLKLNRAFLLFFIEGNEKAKAEYENISSLYPDDPLVKNMRSSFYSFERNLYINSLFSDCVDN